MEERLGFERHGFRRLGRFSAPGEGGARSPSASGGGAFGQSAPPPAFRKSFPTPHAGVLHENRPWKQDAARAAGAILGVLNGCSRHGPASNAGDHGGEAPKTAQISVFGERHEIFAEHRLVVAGTPTKFVTHVTDLKTLEPRREGPVRFQMRLGQEAPIEQVEKASARRPIGEPLRRNRPGRRHPGHPQRSHRRGRRAAHRLRARGRGNLSEARPHPRHPRWQLGASPLGHHGRRTGRHQRRVCRPARLGLLGHPGARPCSLGPRYD